jgi:membrane associated rhomboid family serine protease
MNFIGGVRSVVFQRLREIAHSPTCWAWVVVIIAVHGVAELSSDAGQAPGWFYHACLSQRGFFSGKIWQIFSYGFLHANASHLGLNAIFLLLIGSRIEKIVGPKGMIQATVFGILLGGVSHLILGGKGDLLVGLSGGCMSLLLLLSTLSPQSRMIPIPISAKNLGLGVLFAALLLALINPSLGLPGLSKVGDQFVKQGLGAWFQVGHACHFGGCVAGWLMGRWLLRPRIDLNRLRRDREKRELR